MSTNVKYQYIDKAINEGLLCTICKRPFIDPIETPCRHAFCRPCIHNHLVKKSICPESECAEPLVLESLRPAVLRLCKMVDDLLVKCLDCQQTDIKRCQFDDHLKETCPKALFCCSAVDIRCPWKGRKNQLTSHIASCAYERLRPTLTELISENNQLKQEKPSRSTVDTTTVSQSTEEVNFLRNVICHQNEELEKFIKQSDTNSDIDLREQNVTDLDMGIIVQKAIIDRQCSALQLQGKKIHDQAISVLVHGICNNTTMTKLNLNHNPISDVGVRLLANFLATNNTKIEKLHLCNIRITDQGVTYLAEMLATNTTLKTLGIFRNKFTDQGVEALANVLSKRNTTLTNLYIQNNRSITDASVDSLIEMLKNNQSLILVDIEKCGFTSTGLHRLKQVADKKSNFKLNV